MDDKTKKKIIGAAAGLADPILRKWAQQLAASVSETSILRSVGFETAMGVIKSFIEASADESPTAIWAVVEKTTDFGDFFAGALGSKPKNEIVSNWMERFFREAETRLSQSADPAKELEQLELEFALRKKLLETIEADAKLNQTATASHRAKWQELFSKLKEICRAMIKTLEPLADQADNHNQDWKNQNSDT